MASRKSKAPAPWWGGGLAPHIEFSGVTLEIPAVWSPSAGRWQSPDGRYYFDRAAADKACDFFPEFLRHHIGAFAGQPFELLPYQAKCLTRPLFGWKRAADHLRRFRKVLLFAPKGSGKSPWGSGTALYLTFFDNEPAAEVYALASDKNQARTVHRDAQIMIEHAPELAALCEVLRDSIYVPSTRSAFKVLAADAGGHHGWRPHGVIIDELQQQPNRDQLEVAKKSMAKRRQPVLIMMAHAGTDEESIAYEEHSYAKGVLAGTLTDDTLLPVIFEAHEGEDWQIDTTWRRVNPGYGVTVQPDGIAMEALEARNEPRKLNDFLRFHLNRWTNQATAWLPIEWFTRCEVPTLSPASFAQHECAAGLDMAQTTDFAAFVVNVRVPLPDDQAAPLAEVVDEAGETSQRPLDYSIAVFPFYWLPEERLHEREREDALPLSLYQQRGQLFTCPGATISADQVFRDIVTRIAPMFPRLRTIGFDPAFAPDVAQRLSVQFDVRECPQNFNFMTAPCYLLEGLLKATRVAHAGHPILRWNVSNVAVKRDEAGRLRPVKPRVVGQHRKRIDGVVALLMGLSMLQREAPAAEPAYQMFVAGGRD
ncbi:MAG TPA: terminase large subunit [Gemmatimonadaceae bacterium]|nr:terminase large subunit [Gemmatimonadaceae bacterium]